MIKFEDLKRVNGAISTVDIKGKEYAEVNKRVMAFRELEPNGRIMTDIISLENGTVVMKATITDEDGMVLATGMAYERENSTFINKTSYIENCETSAVGRALGFLGIGIDTSIASAEEVGNAIKQQESGFTKPPRSLNAKEMEKLCLLTKEARMQESDVCKFYKIKSYLEMDVSTYEKACKKLETTIESHKKEK